MDPSKGATPGRLSLDFWLWRRSRRVREPGVSVPQSGRPLLSADEVRRIAGVALALVSGHARIDAEWPREHDPVVRVVAHVLGPEDAARRLPGLDPGLERSEHVEGVRPGSAAQCHMPGTMKRRAKSCVRCRPAARARCPPISETTLS